MRIFGTEQSWRRAVALATLLLLAGGWVACASVPRPDQELAKAEASVRGAEQDGAATHAALELRRAEDALEQAKTSLRAEKFLQARRSAERAQVEAELASAKAHRAQTEAAIEELERTLDALEREIDHENR